MVYEKQNWENLPNETTPISAERLSHMETQYDEAVSYVNSLTNSPGKLKELADNQGWTALFDPSNGSSIAGSSIKDSLGNLPNLSGAGPVQVSPAVFGDFSGVQGTFNMNRVESSTPNFHLMILGEYRRSTATQTLFSSNASGYAIRVNPEGKLFIYTPSGSYQVSIPEGTFLFELEGQPEVIRARINGHWAYEVVPSVEGGFNLPSSNWVVGMSQDSSSAWQGYIGPVLFRETALDRLSTNRMRDFILSRCAPTPTGSLAIDPRVRVLNTDQFGSVVGVQGDPHKVPSHSMASVTKAINALVVRQYYTTSASLDEEVTLQAQDIFSGSSNLDLLQEGDIFTVRELLSLSLSPSNDTAPRVLARITGEKIPGSDPPRAKFVRKMQDLVDSFEHPGGVVQNVRASSMLSSYMGVDIGKRLAEDPELVFCASRPANYYVRSRGVNPRDVFCGHGVHIYGMYWPEFLCGKGGSVGATWSHLTAVWDLDGVRYFTVVFSNHESFWGGITSLRRIAIRAAVDQVRTRVPLEEPGLRSLVGTQVTTSGPRDITPVFSGNLSRMGGYAGSGVYIERVEKNVYLRFVDMQGSANFSIVAAIPPGFRPGDRIRANISSATGASDIPVLVLDTGQIYINIPATTRIYGQLQWQVSWVATDLTAIPGHPPKYLEGTDT